MFDLAETRFNFDRAALPWYGRGNFPIDKASGSLELEHGGSRLKEES